MGLRGVIAALALLFAPPSFAGPGPDLGEPMTEEDIANADISIAPDGATLPVGQGDAIAGKEVYEERCLRCHGEDGEGGEGLADPLVGGIGTLDSDKPEKTVGSFWPYATTIFDYVRRAMPYDRPMSLANEDVYAVTAYILALNGIIDQSAVMDAKSLPEVEMPNRGGFVLYWPETD
jgi:cytochrome c